MAKKKYKALNKYGLPKGKLKDPQVVIAGKERKIDDVIQLEEQDSETISLKGMKWIEEVKK